MALKSLCFLILILVLMLVLILPVGSSNVQTAGSTCFNDKDVHNFTVWITLFSPKENLLKTTDELRLNVRHNGFFWKEYGNCSLSTHITGSVYIVSCKIPRKKRATTNIVQLVVARCSNYTAGLDQRNKTNVQVIAKYEVTLENYQQCIPRGISKENLNVLPKNTTQAIITWNVKNLTESYEQKATSNTEVLIDGRYTARLNCACPQGDKCEAPRTGRVPPTKCRVAMMGFRACTTYEVCVKTSLNKTKGGIVVRCSTYRTPCIRTSPSTTEDEQHTNTMMTMLIIVLMVLVVGVLVLAAAINFKLTSHRTVVHDLIGADDKVLLV